MSWGQSQEAQTEAWQRRFRKAMAYAKSDALRLSNEERRDLARMVPGVDSNGTGSWRDLTQPQLDSLINMLEGWVFITHLLQDRSPDV